jgi:archaellum biogenesis protein FlaJ (TadC family)
LSEAQVEKRKRFHDLYSTLLTPVALIVTVSAVFYVNLAALFGKPERLAFYQLIIGLSVLLLMISAFLYSVARMDSEQYRRRFSQWAFGLMMFAAFLVSVGLVPQTVSGQIPSEDRTLLVFGAPLVYLVAGFIVTVWFCHSKL